MSRDPPPPLPGGYRVGDKVFYTWVSQTFADGDKIVHGQEGEVTGAGTGLHRDKHVSVLFSGNKGSTNCHLREVRRLRAASAATPRLRPTLAEPHPLWLSVDVRR